MDGLLENQGTDSKTFEFTKSQSIEDDYKGLVVFSKSNKIGDRQNICDEIQKHLENIKRNEKGDKDKVKNKKEKDPYLHQ